jgi:hypothetical protein
MSTMMLRRTLALFGPFHWSALSPSRAGRVALGVALPLAVGWSTGHTGYGAYMALGALPAGFASLQGETRSRVTAVALASIGMIDATNTLHEILGKRLR